MGYYTFPTNDPHRWQLIDGDDIHLTVGSNNIITTDNEIADLLLPSIADIGDSIKLISDIGSAWKINQSANQQIVFGDQSTTLGITGYLLSSVEGNSLELVFLSLPGRWIVTSSQGVFEIV